ncbi:MULTISPECIES: VWA domain-containing protein [Bacillus]|uniref:VWA domain-containing protein n=2 Tax=Bacillus pumilus TaxID=1408 RepID=A0AAE4BAH7_BACPU|nr:MULTISPECIES: VWA domain-containing protein [Bacillus]AZV55086.1 VWA domain-containing protein [Bacillus pumilus]MBR0586717.1 VWA domain-containing protein [Bacillus pumilus DW2J2]MBR0616880.1 VWA domain-containing protein [Bacillus pumilus]MBR0620514.1 VWA domain-containing protein [Bacillus pumilus]MBR0624467.1 VWA domain-containing protein [Bacillus pumilus]
MLKKVFTLVTLAVLTLSMSISSPVFAKASTVKKHNKDVRVTILLDASGSMARKVEGERKFDLAKQEVFKFAQSLPKDAKIRMSLFGSEGNNKNSGKAQSCEVIRGVYGVQPYEKESFENSLNGLGPNGWTPIARALENAKQTDEQLNGGTKHIVYLITDGEETCGGDPVKVAKELHNSKGSTVVNVIGLDFNDGYEGQLKQVAKAGKGQYYQASTGKEMGSILSAESLKLHE